MKKMSKAEQYNMMTKTPVHKLILKLAVPTTLAMMGTMIYNLVDTAFVGSLGTSQSGAVGIAFGYMAILQAVGFMFGQGGGSILSRHLGSKQYDEATSVASTGFFSALFTAVVITILSFIFFDPLIVFLGSTPTIKPYASQYLRYIIAASPFILTTFTMNNYLRYEGKAFLGMIGVVTGGILNVFGDAFFIFVLKMGISGVALSTLCSQMVSFGILLSMFLRGKTQTKISIRRVKISFSLIADIVSTGFPSLIRQLLASTGTILLNNRAAIVSGDAAVAAMSIVNRVAFAMYSVALGIGQGFQPVSAFNYGARKYKRLRDGFRTTVIFAEIALVVFSGLILFSPASVIKVFRDDAKVIEIGSRALVLIIIGQLFVPLCMVVEMVMQSTGYRLIASILSSLRNGLIYIPILLIMTNVRGVSGLQEAQPLAYAISFPIAIVFMIYFFRKIPKEDFEEEDNESDSQ